MKQPIIDVPLPVSDVPAPAGETQTNAPRLHTAEMGSVALQRVEITEPIGEVTIIAGHIKGLGETALQELYSHPLFVGDRGGHTGINSKGRSGL